MSKWRLRTLIAAAISLISFVIIASVVDVVSQQAVRSLKQEVGRSLALLADEAQDKLDRAMFERLQALATLAKIGRLADDDQTPESRRSLLKQFLSANPDYASLRFADSNGITVSDTDTGGAHEGQSVLHEQWFIKGKTAEFVDDARGPPVRETGPASVQGAKHPFIDIATPVYSNSGVTAAGVLGGALSSDWAWDVRETLIGGVKNIDNLEILVLDEERRVLLGPDALTGTKISLASVSSVVPGLSDYAIERWADGKTYLSGYSQSDGFRTYKGLRWIVIVREDQQHAFAPATTLRNRILLSGAAFAILSAIVSWIISERLARPLLLLSTSAESLRAGKSADIPEVGGYREVTKLSRSFRMLIRELEFQRIALADANQSLERQVRERTQQLEQQNIDLAKAKTAAEEATEAKSRFLATASHDLRQPLHALSLFTRALSRRVEGEEALILVSQMEEALVALKEMFDALLNISRLDAKLIEPERTAFAVSDVIERISIGAKAEAAQYGLKFRSRHSDWIISSDRALFETILRNLVSNAIKFTHEGGILLATRVRSGARAIDIYDTGPGIAAEKWDTIFQEFSRTDVISARSNDGLGLGLSIARRYCELLGMKIVLCSKPGHGSRFTVVLPVDQSETQMRQPILLRRKIANLTGLKVLVLDDDALIVKALCRDLNDLGCLAMGYQSVAATEEAFAGGLRFDAAVIDLDLGGGETGLAFINRVGTAMGHPIPALILSGSTDASTLAILGQSGRPWLTKPANPESIYEVLGSFAVQQFARDHHLTE